MSSDYGLGRGLASLIPNKNKDNNQKPAEDARKNNDIGKVSEENIKKETEIKNSNNTGGSMQIIEVRIEEIVPNPHQPRLEFNEEKLEELTSSIKSHGIIQPLVVSKSNGQYEIIAGERRFQASKMAGLDKVPVIVRDVHEKEKLELAIVENVQRHDLNTIEEARAYKKLHDDFQLSQEEVALKVGKSRSAIANKIRLLNLPIEIRKAIAEGKISEGHAKAILAVENSEKQRALFELIIKNNLTVRQIEDKTKEISVKSHKRAINVDPEVKDLENKLMGIFGTKVRVTKSGGGGKIIVDYYSKEELEGILNKFERSR